MLFLTIFSLGLVLYLYSLRCLNAPITPGFRYALTACRFGFLALVLWLLTNPQAREIRRITVPSVLYVALDDSQSMSYPPDPAQDRPGRPHPTRWDEILRFLSRQGPAWERLGFEIRYNVFSGSGLSPDSTPPWLSELPHSATPAAPSTDLSAVIGRYERERDPNRPSCLLFFTDGQWNQGPNPMAQAAPLASGDNLTAAKIFTFGIGTANPLFDIVLESVQLPKIARPGEALPLQVHLAARGPIPSSPVMVKVLGQKADGSQVYYEEQAVSFSPDNSEASLTLEIPALPKGDYLFTLESVPQEGEWLANNNRLTRGVQVRDITERVLLLTSGPDWDFKFLKRILESQETITPDVFYFRDNRLFPAGDRPWVRKHATLGPGSAPSDAGGEDTDAPPQSLEAIQSDLSRWALILLHNFTFTAINRPFIEKMNEYVTNGGGLLFLPGANNSMPLSPETRNLLPAPLARMFVMTSQPVLLNLDATPDSPYLAGLRDPSGMEWPPLADSFTPRPSFDSGQVLLQGKNLFDEPVPLVVSYRYGLGRMVILGSHSFWRWNLLTGRDALTPFWLTTLYQAYPNLRMQSGQILVDGYLFEPYEKARFTYTALATVASATASGIPLTVSGPTKRETLWLQPSASTPGQFEGRYTPVEPGEYRVANAAGDATAEFVVENSSLESRDLRQNIEILQAIAKSTGGGYANQPAWKNLADQIPSTAQVREEEHARFLGEKWWMALALIAFLACEWFLRWRKGLP
ncbi:MAG: hypothetical protein ACE15F_00320 [bacterium]